jgi:hypothetical protein
MTTRHPLSLLFAALVATLVAVGCGGGSSSGGSASPPPTGGGPVTPEPAPSPNPPAPNPPTPNPPVTGDFPILFVTQVPVKADFATIGSTFGNHKPGVASAHRGGDLWIRYPDGTLKNLTRAAGLGIEGPQRGNDAIAVRDPSVHWDAQKALFSMVKGDDATPNATWQVYELSGLGRDDTPVARRVPNQPVDFNNITPVYGSDDRIIFTSDRPRNGARHLHPQLDEYESAPTNSGLWSMDPRVAGGDLRLLNHAPSGNFTPIVDSFGRVVFTQWDHLMRDQQAADPSFRTFNYASEAATSARLAVSTEVFPETRDPGEAAQQGIHRHVFNHFFPWTVLEDGSGGETLNHLGRHELHSFFESSFLADPNLVGFTGDESRRVLNLFQVKEDPLIPGRYVGVDAPEFETHASGQVVSITAPHRQHAHQAQVRYVTHKDTKFAADQPSADHSGHYRDPLPLSNGSLIAAHTAFTGAEGRGPGRSLYDFRLKTLRALPSGVWVADAALTPGITKDVGTDSGPLWELQPVEVKARLRPARLSTPVEAPEQSVIAQAGIDVQRLHDYLVRNNLAIAVTRDVTSRDANDRQQPFNLRVPGGKATTGRAGRSYDVAHLQFFQGDQVRGLGGVDAPRPGRRVLAQTMHDDAAQAANPPNAGGPAGSVKVAADGSAAAFVPAQRAMSWQLADAAGAAVVRERYWVSFQPGEVRVCASCHGVNERNQAGLASPTNAPQALLDLLTHWKHQNP